MRCVAAAAPRGRFRASPSPPPPPPPAAQAATRGHTNIPSGSARQSGSRIHRRFSFLLASTYKYYAFYKFWSYIGWKSVILRLVFYKSIIKNVRISEEFHLRLTSLLPVSIKTKYEKVWLINKKVVSGD